MIEQVLNNYGFVQPRGGVATTPEEAVSLAIQTGFPVALKVISPDILHKTDVGGVELALSSTEAVRNAYHRIMSAVSAHAPSAQIEGVRVEEMIAGGFEIIIGLKQDAQFGPVIMFGLGGIFTELLEDVSFRALPLSRADAADMIAEIKGVRVLQGYRGQQPVSADLLIGLLMRASRLGLELGDRFESIDLNPIVVWDNEHRVLDSKIVLAGGSTVPATSAGGSEATTHNPVASRGTGIAAVNTAHLDAFFSAQSVAVVGASATPGKIGYTVLESLIRSKYRGKVFPVNPGRDSILGLPAYPSVSAIPEQVDLVTCTVDLATVPSLMQECAAHGVHNLVIVSGGGKELGGNGAQIETEIRRLAPELDIRVVGPNCIGVFDGHTRLDTFFQPRNRMIRPPAGNVAMLSQSGTVGIAFLEDMVACGVSKFVSYGNRADVDEADLLAYLADDPSTEVIALYVEGFEEGRLFLDTARQVSARKPVVIFKAGRTPSAARAALSHTGFFAGSYKVAAGLFKQAGLVAVDSYEELVAVTKALAMQPQAAGPRVAMIGNGIGTTVQALDILSANGLELAQLSPGTLERLAEIYPSFYVVANPLDVTGSGTSSDYRVGIQALLDDPGVDIVMPWMVFQDAPLGEDIPEVLGELHRTATKPILGGAIGGPFTYQMAAAIEAHGVPMFLSVRDWVAAARGLVRRR